MRTEVHKIAILTESNKSLYNGGYGACVAGITAEGQWIRLVSSEDGDSIPEAEARLIPLGGVIVATVRWAPLMRQIENAVLLDYTVMQESIQPFIRNLSPVNENGIFGNAEKQLSILEARHVVGTLRLINVADLKTYRRPDENCRAEFSYRGSRYTEIAMTAPGYYAAEGTTRPFGDALIVVSLPENPPYIKFVAAVYPR